MPCPIKTAIVAAIAVFVLFFQLDYNGWATSFKEAKDKTIGRRVAYYIFVAALVLFHIELFSGGMACRLIFARQKQLLTLPTEMVAVGF